MMTLYEYLGCRSDQDKKNLAHCLAYYLDYCPPGACPMPAGTIQRETCFYCWIAHLDGQIVINKRGGSDK